MATPKSNGLFEVNGKRDKDAFCIDLIRFLSLGDTVKTKWEEWLNAIDKAQKGRCPFRNKCKRHKRTLLKKWKRRIQKNRPGRARK